MTTIYLAIVGWDHEGTSVIAAYATQADAEAFVASCRAHMLLRPAYLNWKAAAVEKEKYFKAMEEWHAAEPPDFISGDGYSVESYEVRGAS